MSDNFGEVVVSLKTNGDLSVVTYTATDAAGNMAECTSAVSIIDVTPPKITCPANLTVIIGANDCGGDIESYLQPALAIDNCGPISVHTEIFEDTVTYTAIDGAKK